MNYRAFFTSVVVAACAYSQLAAPPPKTAEAPALRDLSDSLQQLSRRVRTSVVQIFSTSYASVEDAEGSANTAALLNKQHSTGSGVILSADVLNLPIPDWQTVTAHEVGHVKPHWPTISGLFLGIACALLIGCWGATAALGLSGPPPGGRPRNP